MKDQEKILYDLHEKYGEWFKEKDSIPRMTNKLFPYKNMFSPVKVNSLTLKNRLVMAPIGNVSMCDETGRPNERMIAYFEERAKGGVGLITTGLVPVSYGIDPTFIEKGNLVYFPRIDSSRTVFAGWRDLAMKCHSHGAALFIQLSAGLGRVGNPQCLLNFLKLPVSASWNPNFYMPQIPCRPLSERELKKIINQIGQAAADAKAANIDGVYLHAHEGYLFEQLANSAYNRRKFGKYSDKCAFGVDTVSKIRERCGNKFPIMFRIDLSLALNATYGDKMNTVKSLRKFKNERSIEDTLKYMAKLVEAGVDMFDVDLGSYDNWWLPHPPASMPPACFLEIAEIAKNYFKENNIKANTGLDVPITAVGKLGYPDLAEKALRDNKCDMIMLGRPLLADPEWPKKAFSGEIESIVPCIGCQEGCINEFIEGGHPQCAVNPRCAFEAEIDEKIEKAEVIKKIAVIGAGPSGIIATDILLKRGHKVDLYEKEKFIGGLVNQGSAPKIKYEFSNYLAYLNFLLSGFTANSDFQLIKGKEVKADELKAKGYDAIFVATGSKQVKPPVEGIDNKNVHFAIDVLANPQIVKDATDIVIIGGGVVGVETAYFLTYEHGKKVKVVEMLPYLMNNVCTANRGHLIHYLEKAGVELLNMTRLKSVKDKSVEIIKNISRNKPDPYVTWHPVLPENVLNPLAKKIGEEYQPEILKADAVIISAGVISENDLYYELVNARAAKEIYNIGDSLKPGRILEAVRTAYRKARVI
ncbi:MAG: FAD-dependent oxidoreductase [Christensenellales bacterium]|jgi:2-enoate reductase